MEALRADLSEARFSPPTGLCPNPEYWTSTDDASTEIEVSELLAGLIRGLQPEFCVETGSAFGQTAEAIGHALVRNGHGRLVSLETDPERVETSRARCQGLPVLILEQPSLDYVPERQIDFAFFDSLFPLRVPEFVRFRPWMRVGTVVAFHDTAPLHGGGQLSGNRDLRQELEAELSDSLRLLHLPTPRGLTIGEVL